MKRKLLFISIIFTILLAGCSNLVNELLESFTTQNATAAVKSNYSLDSVTGAESENPGIATVTVSEDGSVTFTGVAPGTTNVTIKATATNPENGGAQTVTVVYEVTVADDGAVTCKVKGKDVVDHFKENTETIEPKTDSAMASVGAAESSPEGIVTATKNDDGTVTLTAKKVGATTVTVNGKDANGVDIIISYPVTIGRDGTITKGTPVVFTSQTETLTPKSDSAMTDVQNVADSPEGIVTATKNDDGTVTLVSKKPGSTTVTVKGKDGSNDDVTLTYPVTVAPDGTITKGTPVVFTNQTKTLTPKTDSVMTSVTESGVAPQGIVEITENADGTVKIVAKSPGTAKVTVKGTDSAGDEITITYAVTVAADGTVTKEVFTSQTKKIAPVTAGSLVSEITAASGNNGIATVSANPDGTYTITSTGEGATTITVGGKNGSNEDVDVTYSVTVDSSGKLSVGAATVNVVCTISFDANGGTGTIPSVRRPKDSVCTINGDASNANNISVDASPLYKQHCSVSGWAESADGTAVTSVTVSSNITLYAVWAPNSLSPTVTLETVSTDAAVGLTETSGTFTANTGFANYLWKMDGSVITGATTNSYTPDSATLEAGKHKITLVVTDSNGYVWSATAVFTLSK